MTLTLSALLAELTGLRLHGLTETNVVGIETGPRGVTLDGYDRDADAMDDLRADLKTSENDLKQAEAERDEWERRLLSLETQVDDMREREELGSVVLDLREDRHRTCESIRAWTKECETLRKELSALRKRKGVEAGVCAYSHEIRTLLGYVAQTEGRYQQQAKEISDRINASF